VCFFLVRDRVNLARCVSEPGVFDVMMVFLCGRIIGS
jgi:hypothetical protein